jgi:L-arabinonolactonase
MIKPELLLDCRNELGECPTWHEGEGALYWIDVAGCRLYRMEGIDGHGAVTSWELGENPGSFVFRAHHDNLLMAFRRGLAFVTLRPDGSVQKEPIEHAMFDCGRGRFNDGVCDQRGRFWVGQIDRKQPAEPLGYLYRVDPDLSVLRMDGGISISNGIAFSPDQSVMYYADTKLGTIYAYDFDSDTGINSNKRIFVRTDPGQVRPDGCTIDGDGCLWVAEPSASRLTRYHSEGTVDRHVQMPGLSPTSLSFAGPDLDILVITTMRHGYAAAAANPHAGGLFAMRPGVSGPAKTSFEG